MDQQYKFLKKKFQLAFHALRKLDHGSVHLPDEVCRKIWISLHELKRAYEIWEQFQLSLPKKKLKPQ